jgi:hypothetical protein
MTSEKRNDGQRQVFFDDKGHRGRFASYVGFVIGATVTILILFFVVSVLINPFLPQIRLKPVATFPQAPDTGLPIPEAPTLSRRDLQVKQESEKVKIERQKRDEERAQRIEDRQLRQVAQSATVDQTGVEKTALGRIFC